MKRADVNLLAIAHRSAFTSPHSHIELGSDFDLNKVLQNGLLPIVIQSERPEDTLKTYINLFLKEEVQAESLVGNIGHFARFLEIASFSHASILEYQQYCKRNKNILSFSRKLFIRFRRHYY